MDPLGKMKSLNQIFNQHHLTHPDLPDTVASVKILNTDYDAFPKEVVLEIDRRGGIAELTPRCHSGENFQVFVDTQRMLVRIACSKCELTQMTFPLKIRRDVSL
jgi:hypothetical protein